MIAASHHPHTAEDSVALWLPTGSIPQALALGYLRYASACWRGDPDAGRFASRLGAFSRADPPPAPARPAAAVSPHGRGGRGIRWRQIGGEVVDYVPGVPCGSRAPTARVAELVHCAPATSGPDLATLSEEPSAPDPIVLGARP